MELYHVLNRGVDKRSIFLDNKDYFRFVHGLFEFNDEDLVNSTLYTFRRQNDLSKKSQRRCNGNYWFIYTLSV
jgi:putative transposase